MGETDCKGGRLVLGFIGGISLLRLLMISSLPLTPDEAYYFAWSRRPAVCYYDQPGLVAWVDWLFALPWPRPAAFSVRLAAVVLSGLSTWLVYRAAREYVEQERPAAVFAVLYSLLPFTSLTGIIMIHDTVLLPCLAWFMWMMIRLVKGDGKFGDWLLVALSLTLAMYAKFSAVMAAWGLVLYMLWSPKGRRWFRSRRPYAAGLFVFIFYLPVLWWNYQHDWISVRAVQELTGVRYTEIGKRLGSFLEFVLSQVGIFSPLIGITVFGAFFIGVGEAVRDPRRDQVTLPVSLALPVFLYFFQLSLRSHVFGNWPGVAYLPIGLLALRETEARLREGKAGGIFGRRFLIGGFALNFLLLAALWFHIQLGIFRPLLSRMEEKYRLEKRLDERLDKDFRGWEEMAALVQAHRPGHDFILAHNYQVASMLEFLLPDRPEVECYNVGQRGNQWDVWSGLARRQGQSALYVDFKKMPKAVRERFTEVRPFPVLVVGEEPRPVRRWFVYRAAGWKGP